MKILNAICVSCSYQPCARIYDGAGRVKIYGKSGAGVEVWKMVFSAAAREEFWFLPILKMLGSI